MSEDKKSAAWMRHLVLSIFIEAVNDTENGEQILVRQGMHAVKGFLDENRLCLTLVKEILGRNIQILTDIEELIDGRFGSARNDVVNVASAMT